MDSEVTGEPVQLGQQGRDQQVLEQHSDNSADVPGKFCNVMKLSEEDKFPMPSMT